MAVNIFEKYGIKEVANVQFQALSTDLKAGVYEGDIVLFLDTLKVSTIETTAENTAAQGGWGNPKLVQWDYGKEINVTLEDALMSLESLRFMLGGAIKRAGKQLAADKYEEVIIRHNEEVVCEAGGIVPLPVDHITGYTFGGEDGKLNAPTATYKHPIRLLNLTKGTRTQLVVEAADGDPIALDGAKAIKFVNPSLIDEENNEQLTEEGDHIRIFWDEIATKDSKETAVEITISPSTYPGTYRIVGDTFMRSEKTGKDEAFQFVINKAKVSSEVTLTLEAEGDPTTFEMTLSVLRDKNERGEDEMMKLIRYNIAEDEEEEGGNDWGSVSGGSNP